MTIATLTFIFNVLPFVAIFLLITLIVKASSNY